MYLLILHLIVPLREVWIKKYFSSGLNMKMIFSVPSGQQI